MTQEQQNIPWTRAGWLEAVTGWIRAHLDAQGITLAGELESQQSNAWSTVLRVPTGDGTLFFKAASPLQPQEPAALAVLHRVRPDCTPRLLASDEERGWMLLADGGTPLRNSIRPTQDLAPWQSVLPLYAQVQIDMVEHVPELIARGVPDRRLATLPDLFAALLEDRDILRIGEANGITPEQDGQVRALLPRIAELCAELASCGIPETINHGDLTDGNIVVRDGTPTFIDWGDSCVSHPFFSLRTALVSAEISLDLPDYAPETDLLRDAYLSGWSRFGTPDELARIFSLSLRLAPLNGALAWYGLVSNLAGEARERYAAYVPAYVQEFLATEAGEGWH